MPAITANKTCAVQILEVALSLFMCCSLVWRAILNALFPFLSLETPIILPGMDLLYSFFVAKYPACGPPYPKGIPNLCEVPTTTSQLKSDGFSRIQSESKSAATINFMLWLFNISEMVFKLCIFPYLPVYWI